jgi:hypothetical protein
MHQHLPSLSDMLDARQKPTNHPTLADGLSYPSRPARSSTKTSLDGVALITGGRAPALHESSSNGTNMSGNLTGSFGWFSGLSSGEGPLPIHALLSNRTALGPSVHEQTNPVLAGGRGMVNKELHPLGFAQGPSGYGTVPFMSIWIRIR